MLTTPFISSNMSIPPLDRLLFAQGGCCFFCSDPLQRKDATVEHLDAKVNGGTNSDKNCVVCCGEMNMLLGCMSLKEKIKVILNQNGKFDCPKKLAVGSKQTVKSIPNPAPATENYYRAVLANLERRKDSRPKKVETLRNSIRSVVVSAKGSLTDTDIDSLLVQLQRNGKIQITGTAVTYLI